MMEKPTAGFATIALNPTTAVRNNRYDRKSAVLWSSSLVIHQGTHTSVCQPRPAFVPTHWTMYIHPEGAVFYVSTREDITIVTDAPIGDAATLEKVNAGIDKFWVAISSRASKLPKNTELYICANRDDYACGYYLVDHDAQVEFWLEDVDMSTMGIPQVSSEAHIKYVLQEHYWIHTEYFPHRPVPVYLRIELVDIIRHGRADHMTSDNSTFPYSAEQCAEFTQLINVNAEETTTYMTCLTARIWAMIARHRYDNFYGEQHARLCRDQSVLEMPEVGTTSAMRLGSALLFNFPKALRKELELLYVDKIVYAIHWRGFVRSMTAGWRDDVMMCLGLLLTNAALMGFVKDTPSMTSGLASMVLALGGVLSGCTLQHAYASAEKVNAASVAIYLRDIEHRRSGFEPLAAVLSIPKALTLWSILFLFSDILTLFVVVPDWLNMAALGLVAALVVGAFASMAAILRRPSIHLMV